MMVLCMRPDSMRPDSLVVLSSLCTGSLSPYSTCDQGRDEGGIVARPNFELAVKDPHKLVIVGTTRGHRLEGFDNDVALFRSVDTVQELSDLRSARIRLSGVTMSRIEGDSHPSP